MCIRDRFGGIARLKHIFIFDEDIDIRNDLQVEWALGTRFQADQDLVMLTGIPGMSMDPSLQGRRTGAKTGFDCTKPFGREGEIPLTRSAAKVFKGPARFQTISLSRAAWLSAGICWELGAGQFAQCRSGSSVPATTPRMNIQGQRPENRWRQSLPGYEGLPR